MGAFAASVICRTVRLHADVPRFVRVVDLLLRRQRGSSMKTIRRVILPCLAFILKGTKEVFAAPSVAGKARRKTIGLRTVRARLRWRYWIRWAEPMLSTSLMLLAAILPKSDPEVKIGGEAKGGCRSSTAVTSD